MAWPTNKKHDPEALDRIKATRKAQEAAKSPEDRKAQNEKIKESVKATLARKAEAKKDATKQPKKSG